ncbi:MULTISPECIES: hypothetical protein [unclassified Pseudomonas]|jgi:hypothetical protein|uniref:hypothetical protein n=1 Tax=unclassified Pseudomonas TaxID=196821 RepID=UPI0013200C86|nr:hypothetical protein [Pseudomonas sp. R84]QHC97616.1 hypothetical protein PspR84_24250 [Pseudomonas sp. R84]
MSKPKHYSKLSKSGIIIPYMPFSHSCAYKITVDEFDPKRVHFLLTGLTENGLKELAFLDGRADLLAQNFGGYRSRATEYGSDSSDSYYWTFPAAGTPTHFTISDGAGNPFRINFTKKNAREFKFECEFFLVFGKDHDYDPRGNYIFIDYLLPSPGSVLRDNFAKCIARQIKRVKALSL